MRFFLLENDADIEAAQRDEDNLRALEKEWRTADSKRRETIMSEILQRLGDNEQERKALTALKGAFRASCRLYGIEFSKNPFMGYLQKLVSNSKLKVEAKHDRYLAQLVNMSESNISLRNRIKATAKGNKDASYLLNPSLFYRNPQEFNYTVQIFENVLEPTKLQKFFKDTSNISVDQLYDGKKIKPAGDPNTAADENTLFGQVEMWSGKNGENDAGDIELSTNDGEAHSQRFDKSSNKKSNSLSPAQLQKIKTSKDTHFTSLKAAEDAGVKDGQVVYIDFNKDMAVDGISDDNWVDTWMVRKNGKWQKYDV